MNRFLLVFLLVSLNAAAQPAFVRDSMDGYIRQGMLDWQVPGLSLVIVKDGQVAVMKGYGVRDIQTSEPVDEQTLFMIASNTKLFTGTALALLETRGQLSLDDPIRKFYPGFALFDPAISRMVTVRDMLTHRIGTKTFQGDFTFWNTNLSRQEIMKRMRLLKPSMKFRQDYGYCNSCFLTAGEVIPKAIGRQWEQVVQDSMLTPLKMTSSLVLSTGIASQKNVATPYTTSFTNRLQQVPYDNWNNLAPAASIVSNVKDLSNWLIMQLDSGRFEGKQVLPWSVLQKTRDVQIVTGSRKSAVYPMHFRGYGLGVFAADYNGRQIYWHTGGAGGMVSNICFVPEERLGIAILTNNDNQNFFEALRYQILDAYLGVAFVNRSRQQLPGFNRDMMEQTATIAGWKERLKGSKPSLPLKAYVGTYTNDLYGTISITNQGSQLRIAFSAKPDLWATLDYMDNGEWLMQYNNIEYGTFAVKFGITGGKVKSITTKQNEFVEYDPYTFTKLK